LSELYLIYNEARQKLETAGCVIARSLVGNFVSSLDMAGCSVTVLGIRLQTHENRIDIEEARNGSQWHRAAKIVGMSRTVRSDQADL
jgi:dihydroxyacetone kinase